jgi:hypothetical protein
VFVDIDAMERAKGGQHKLGKAEKVAIAEAKLRSMGVTIGAHPKFGRADIVAEHLQHGICIVEVEGNSSRQKEQAMYSALGQLVLQMKGDIHSFMLAIPDEPQWEKQALKIPKHALSTFGLSCALVSPQGVRII